MCGIVAYVGRKVAQPLLIEGLKRLEYRGYDSAGIAVIDAAGQLHIRKAVGRISVLEDSINTTPFAGDAHVGMAHTRWATHGAPNEVNGTYGTAVVCQDEPDTLGVARKGSPLIIGVGKDEYVVASDASAIVEHTTQVIYLNDNEMAVLKPGQFRTTTIDDIDISPVISQLENTIEEYELGDYEHFMLKEIFEQPTAVKRCLSGRVDAKEGKIILGGVSKYGRELVKARRFIFTGQGTA